jgi:Zn-finger protein
MAEEQKDCKWDENYICDKMILGEHPEPWACQMCILAHLRSVLDDIMKEIPEEEEEEKTDDLSPDPENKTDDNGGK